MIWVISNLATAAAGEFIRRFPSETACLIQASDLHQIAKIGIRIHDFPASIVSTHGRSYPISEIRGVLTLVPCFYPQELYHLEAGDRQYACAELNAFFIYFLHALRAAKMNPPGLRTLSGIDMNKIGWMRAAERLGIPVYPFSLHTKNTDDSGSPGQSIKEIKWLTLIDEVIFGEDINDSLRAIARKLADSLSLSYLSASFITGIDNKTYLSEISTVPTIGSADQQSAIIRFFERRNAI